MSKEPYKYSCPMCGHFPFIRIHKEGNILCSHCYEPLLKDVDSHSFDRYIVCPNPECRYSGPETVNPNHGSKCIKCGIELL